MAKRRRKRLKTRRRKSKVTLGRVVVGFILLALVLYFVFTQVFFDPFEEPQASFELLVPRDVDVFVHRDDLATDFNDFPMPVAVERLLRMPEWKAMAQTGWFDALEWPDGLAAWSEQLEQDLAEAPLDLMDDVLGREVAIVGRHVGTADDFALLARLSAAGKVAVDSLGFAEVRSQVFPGSAFEELADPDVPSIHYNHVTLADGSNLYWARVTDLLLIGDDEELVRDTLRSVKEGTENVIGLSRTWTDHLPMATGPTDRLLTVPFALDGKKLVETYELSPSMEERSADAVLNILPNVLDVEAVKDLVGRLEIDGARVSLRMHAELDVGRIAANQGGLVGQTAFTADERLRDLLGLVPTDTAAVITMNVSLREFLETVTRGFDPDLLVLINSSLRDVARYSPGFGADNLNSLIGLLDRAFGGELTIVMRAIDHDVELTQQPLPSMGFMLPVRNLSMWEEIENALIAGNRALGIDSNDMFRVNEGVGYRKWLGLVAGPVEEIAYIVLDGERLVLTTDDDFLQEIVQVYTGQRSSAASQAEVRAALDAFRGPAAVPPQANLAVWGETEAIRRVLEPYAGYLAEVETQLDYGVLRAQAQSQLLASEYPQYRDDPDAMPDEVRAEIDAELDRQLRAQDAERIDVTVPRLAAEWWDGWSWIPLMRQAIASLRLGERSLDVDIVVETAVGRIGDG